VKKHPRVKKQPHKPMVEPDKLAQESATAEPQIIETTSFTFEPPVEFVVMEPKPIVDVVEVFEVVGAGDEDEV